jgi:hypothetical protein
MSLAEHAEITEKGLKNLLFAGFSGFLCGL